MLGFAMTFTGRINGHRSILQARATPAIRLYRGDFDRPLVQELLCGSTHEGVKGIHWKAGQQWLFILRPIVIKISIRDLVDLIHRGSS